METSSSPGGPLYWPLIALVLPLLNWWLGLSVLVLTRDAASLLLVPLLLLAEGLGVSRLRRAAHARISPFGTAGLLLVLTIAWSFLLTLVAISVQGHAFTV